MKYILLLSLSWIFLPATYTHRGGVRVGQYARVPAVAVLPIPQARVYSRRYQHDRGYFRMEIYDARRY